MRRLTPLSVGLVLLGLAFLRALACGHGPPPVLAGDLLVRGVVVDAVDTPEAPSLDVQIEEARAAWPGARATLPARGPVVVRILGTGGARRGDLVTAAIRARVLPRYHNPGVGPAWPRATDSPCCVGRLAHGEALVVSGRAPSVSGALASEVEPLRAALRAGFRRTLAPEAASLARAMVLGEARALPVSDRDALSRSGLAHLVAVSGLNVVLVVGALAWALRQGLRRIAPLAARWDVGRIAGVATVPLCVGFTALAGFQPSAVRAAVMAAMAGVVVALGRRPRASPLLGATVIAACLAEGDAPREPGFVLSVLATAALVRISTESSESSSMAMEQAPPPGRARRALDWIRAHTLALVRTNVRASLATAPVILWLFGRLPVIGLLANLIAVPWTSLVVLPLCLVHGSIAVVCAPLASRLAPLTELATSWFLALAELSAAAPAIETAPPTALELACAGAAAAGLLWPARWPRRAMVVFVALLGVGGSELVLRLERAQGTLSVTFLDVGQGDAALVELPGGARVLVDAGDRVAGARAVVPYLRARRITRLDAVVVTHPHPDHYGGVEAVAAAVAVGEIWDVGFEPEEGDDGGWASVRSRLRRLGIGTRLPSSLCRSPPLPGVVVLAPCPAADPLDGANDASLVLRVSHGRRAVLLAGDVERRGEAFLRTLDPALLRADVLKVPHHGSRTSSDVRSLRLVSPTLAIASLGPGNRFGHPHESIERRYRELGIRLLRTDRSGGVVVRTDGRSLAWETTLEPP